MIYAQALLLFYPRRHGFVSDHIVKCTMNEAVASLDVRLNSDCRNTRKNVASLDVSLLQVYMSIDGQEVGYAKIFHAQHKIAEEAFDGFLQGD